MRAPLVEGGLLNGGGVIPGLLGELPVTEALAGSHKNFKQVAAQHTFPVQRTDKAHAQKLAAFKDTADDAPHRPISGNVPLVTMNDLPEPTRLRAVLHELAQVLRKPELS
ncbi:hypothetical protein ACFU5Y_01015 [Streptomyces gardneri]|uniref:hypothetical protein n=1 Tax=Streptomyces gardneri TaxID=66892 RepID=UPI0036810461